VARARLKEFGCHPNRRFIIFSWVQIPLTAPKNSPELFFCKLRGIVMITAKNMLEAMNIIRIKPVTAFQDKLVVSENPHNLSEVLRDLKTEIRNHRGDKIFRFSATDDNLLVWCARDAVHDQVKIDEFIGFFDGDKNKYCVIGEEDFEPSDDYYVLDRFILNSKLEKADEDEYNKY
jgi:hypothetical protein